MIAATAYMKEPDSSTLTSERNPDLWKEIFLLNMRIENLESALKCSSERVNAMSVEEASDETRLLASFGERMAALESKVQPIQDGRKKGRALADQIREMKAPSGFNSDVEKYTWRVERFESLDREHLENLASNFTDLANRGMQYNDIAVMFNLPPLIAAEWWVQLRMYGDIDPDPKHEPMRFPTTVPLFTQVTIWPVWMKKAATEMFDKGMSDAEIHVQLAQGSDKYPAINVKNSPPISQWRKAYRRGDVSFPYRPSASGDKVENKRGGTDKTNAYLCDMLKVSIIEDLEVHGLSTRETARKHDTSEFIVGIYQQMYECDGFEGLLSAYTKIPDDIPRSSALPSGSKGEPPAVEIKIDHSMVADEPNTYLAEQVSEPKKDAR